jgi:NTE family protein
MEDKYADLVFEGGGVKGIGLAGAYAALQQNGFTHKSVAGTSAGAITAALVAAGYTSEELDAIILKLPFASFKDESFVDKLPGGKLASVLTDLGIYEGEVFQQWMAGLLAAKGKTRFGDIVNEDAEDPDGRWCLRVIASDVTHRRMLVLPNDAGHLGYDDPGEMDIAYAVRMSMSIPIFFEPVKHKNPKTGDTHIIVDGGMLSNFPVWLFDCKDRDPRWPTFGLMLVEPEPKKPIGHRIAAEVPEVERNSVVDFVKSLALTMMAAHDRMYLDQATYARTIPIPTLGVGTTEFEITPDRVQALYQSGHTAATEFLKTWDFQAYIQEHRRGRTVSRRETVLAGPTNGATQPAAGSP